MIRQYIVAGMLITGLTVSAAAQEAGKALPPAAIEQIHLAAKLSDYGIARNDPLLLIAAARMLKAVSEEPVAAQKGMSPEDLLAKAKEMAGGREDIVGLADDVAAETSKGLCHGPGTVYGCF